MQNHYQTYEIYFREVKQTFIARQIHNKNKNNSSVWVISTFASGGGAGKSPGLSCNVKILLFHKLPLSFC